MVYFRSVIAMASVALLSGCEPKPDAQLETSHAQRLPNFAEAETSSDGAKYVGMWADEPSNCGAGFDSLLLDESGGAVGWEMVGTWRSTDDQRAEIHFTTSGMEDEENIDERYSAHISVDGKKMQLERMELIKCSANSANNGSYVNNHPEPIKVISGAVIFENIAENTRNKIRSSTTNCIGDLVSKADFVRFDINGDGLADYYTENGVSDYSCRGNAHYSSVWISKPSGGFISHQMLISTVTHLGKNGDVLIGRSFDTTCDYPTDMALIGWNASRQEFENLTGCLSEDGAKREAIKRYG